MTNPTHLRALLAAATPGPPLPDDEIEVSMWLTNAPGGQQAGTPPCWVLVTHKPTGIAAAAVERSQMKAMTAARATVERNVAAVTALPGLLEEIDALREQVCRLKTGEWTEGDLICHHDEQYLAKIHEADAPRAEAEQLRAWLVEACELGRRGTERYANWHEVVPRLHELRTLATGKDPTNV